MATAISIIAGCSKNQLEPAASINDPEISETVIENAKKTFLSFFHELSLQMKIYVYSLKRMH